jgi:large repetitive protein
MWRIRRLAVLPALPLLITAVAAISIPPANAGTSPDPGMHTCALNHNGQLRYVAVPGECAHQGETAALQQHKPPVLGDIESSALKYDAGAAPVRVTPSLTVTSPATLTGATVSVSSGFTAGQDALAFAAETGIAGAYDASSGVLTFTGTATASAYATELRSVTYSDAAATPYGTRAVSFQVSDSEPDHSLSNVVSRSVLVTAKPPVAAGDKATTGNNATVTISVLANDTDPAGLPLTIASVNTTGTKGTVTVNPGHKTVAYNPNGQFAGLAAGKTATDKFTYQATDGTQTSNSATVTVTITGSGTSAAQPPTVTAHSYKAVGNTPLGVGTAPTEPAATVTGTVLSGDSDQDPAATLSVTANTAPGHGTVTMNPNGTFTYTPNPGFSGTDSFRATIAGSNDPSLTSTETVTITVGTVVWYVNNSDSAAGNGQAGSPFNTLAAADSAAGPDSIVFLYQGKTAYTGGITMQAGEDLWGQPQGLTIGGYALVPAGGSLPAITNGSGDGIDLAGGADVEGVNVSGPSGNGITALNVTDATVGATAATAVTGAGGDGISIDGGDGNLNFGATSVIGATGYAVSVARRSGGTVTFAGPINAGGVYLETEGGVYLDSNDGATIAFTGKLNLDVPFTATGGGTVTATGADSTINAPDALAVLGTTIGAAGLTFQSISYSGSPANGIDLDDTGSSGRLTVTGTGTPGSGGTIIGSTEPGSGYAGGIELTSTYAPSFTDMVIEYVGSGIDGSQVNGLTLADCTLTGTPLQFSGLTGAVSITNSTIDAPPPNGQIGVGDQSGITDDSGTLDLTVTGTTFDGGLAVTADGSANSTVSATGSTFNGINGSPFQFSAGAAATGFDRVTFTGDSVLAGGGFGYSGDKSIYVTAAGSATVCAAITGNTIFDDGGQGIQLAQDDTSTIELPGYTGGPEDTSAVESFLAGGNSGALLAVATVSGSGGGFTGATGC